MSGEYNPLRRATIVSGTSGSCFRQRLLRVHWHTHPNVVGRAGPLTVHGFQAAVYHGRPKNPAPSAYLFSHGPAIREAVSLVAQFCLGFRITSDDLFSG